MYSLQLDTPSSVKHAFCCVLSDKSALAYFEHCARFTFYLTSGLSTPFMKTAQWFRYIHDLHMSVVGTVHVNASSD